MLKNLVVILAFIYNSFILLEKMQIKKSFQNITKKEK